MIVCHICFTQNLLKFLNCTLQFCAIDSRFLHKTVLKSCLLKDLLKAEYIIAYDNLINWSQIVQNECIKMF